MSDIRNFDADFDDGFDTEFNDSETELKTNATGRPIPADFDEHPLPSDHTSKVLEPAEHEPKEEVRSHHVHVDSTAPEEATTLHAKTMEHEPSAESSSSPKDWISIEVQTFKRNPNRLNISLNLDIQQGVDSGAHLESVLIKSFIDTVFPLIAQYNAQQRQLAQEAQQQEHIQMVKKEIERLAASVQLQIQVGPKGK